MSTQAELQQQLDRFRADFVALRQEMAKVIVGQDEVIDAVLSALIAGGHILVEGLPGTGKTLTARTLAEVAGLSIQRIQCTPDLMPADVIGTYVIMETPQGRRTFEFQKGPLFANIVLADQVNRTTPRTQSAFLEAMEEEAITVSTETFLLPQPYTVIATQNPHEMEGTFPLPEAEIDRFLLKVVMRAPDVDQMEQILDRTTEDTEVMARAVSDGSRILKMGGLVRTVSIARQIRRWGISVVAATNPQSDRAPDTVRRYVRYGSSPRGAQAMVLAAKIRAVLDGRFHVSHSDLRAVAPAALRHRVILNYEGQAEEIDVDWVIQHVMEAVAVPQGDAPGPPSDA